MKKCQRLNKFKENMLSSTALIIFLFFNHQVFAQSAHKHLRKGDAAYKNQDFKTAETEYRKADEKKASVKSGYNLGNSLYSQERYEESGKVYNETLNKTTDDKTKSSIYHNLGNSLFNQQKYKESVDAYKEALRYNAEGDDTKKNLMLARAMLKQQQQQQNNDQKNNDKNDPQNNPQQDQQENNDPAANKQENENKRDQKNPSDANNMSKDDAEKLLEIIENEDKKVQEKLKKASGQNRKTTKDW